MDNADKITLQDIQNKYFGIKNQENEFPIDIFEDDLKNFIIDIHERLDAPIEYIAMSIMTGAAVIMNGTYKILVNPISGWIDYPILWVALVGEASKKKSPCLNFVKTSIDKLENHFSYDYKEKLKDFRIKLAEYKKNSKENPGLEPPEPPQKQRMTTQNATVEALGKATLKNSTDTKRGVSIWTDELAMLILGIGQYKSGKNNDEAYFLQSWSKQRHNVMRSTDDIDYIIYPAHTIIGTIQPKVLEQVMFSHSLGSENGFMERWLYVTTNYVETGMQANKTTPLDKSILNSIYKNLFMQKTEKEYHFSPDAQKLYNEFCYDITQKKNSDNVAEIMKTYLQKHTQYAPRFALTLHGLKYQNKDIFEIEKSTVENAIRLSNYFIKSYENIAIKRANSNTLADFVLHYLLLKGKNSISPSELYKSNYSKFKNSEHAKITLEQLAKRAYGRIIKSSNGCKFQLYKYH